MASPGEELDTAYLSGPKLWAVLTAVTLASFIMLLDMAIIATAIPQMTDEFNSLPDIGWYGSAYILASATLQPLTGRLYSHLNSKWTFMSFIAILEVGSVICGFASSSVIFIVGRVIAGMGTSGIMNGALTIIAASVPLVKRPAITGIVVGLAYFGNVAGPLIGGALTEHATWRWCFWMNLPIGAVACACLFVTSVPEHLPKRVSCLHLLSLLDLPGFVLLASAVSMILLALQYGGSRYPWSSATVIGLLCGGFVTITIFALWERFRNEKAMIPPLLLSERVVWSSSLVAAFMTSALMVHSYYLPIYFQAVRDVQPTLSGVYLLPSILAQLVSSGLAGFVVSKIGYCLPALLLSSVMVAIGGGILSLLDPETPTSKWVGYQILLGFGRGVGLQMPVIAVQAILKPDLIPIGMSLVVFSQTFGGSIFLTVANILFNTTLRMGISRLEPEVSAAQVIGAGATAFRSVVPEAYLGPVVHAYSQAVSAVFYLSAALAVVYFAFSWGIGWTNVKTKESNA
ncbi:efflux pump [Xylariaceae sp. FL0662B]|nr:efflux pump [Xylariaceae sp. FL0662B]